MAARTDTELLAYDATARTDMGFAVVEFRQLLEAQGAVLPFDCVVTIVFKRDGEVWHEARWHASLVRGPSAAD